jgi:hypothetical protein
MPRATPRYTAVRERLLKITLVGTDAKINDNEELVQKAVNINICQYMSI